MTMSHYDILGSPANAEYVEIRSKYRAAILALHPDKVSNSPDQSSETLHSELNDGLSLLSRKTITDEVIPSSIFSKIKELDVGDKWFNLTTTCKAGAVSIGEEGVLSRFLRVQKAWEVLRDPESRATYDRFLSTQRFDREVNSRRGESIRIIGEEISLREMDVSSVDGKVEDGEYSYPCRCGDLFLVSQQELCLTGVEFNKETSQETTISESQSPSSNGGNKATENAIRENADRGIRIRVGPEAHRPNTNSLVLPCQSCSLHLRVHLFC